MHRFPSFFRRATVVLGLTALTVGLAPSAVQAQSAQLCSASPGGYTGYCEAPATEYVQTIVSFGLRRTDGTIVTLGSTTASFDAAAASAGSTIGTYLSSIVIPPGTYDAVVPTMTSTWTVAGTAQLSDGSGVCRTTSSGAAPGAGTASSYTTTVTLSTFGGSLPSGMSFVDGGTKIQIVDTTPSGLPLTITGSETVTFTIAFGVSRGLGFNYTGGTCTSVQPGPMDVTLSISTS